MYSVLSALSGLLVSLAYNATDVPSPLSDVIVVVNSPPALELSSELILELLSDKEDVNELIVRTLAANSFEWSARRVSWVNSSLWILLNKFVVLLWIRL